MSSASNRHDHRRDDQRVRESAQRPHSSPTRPAGESATAPVDPPARSPAPAAPPAAPAREDLDPVSFQRNAVDARLDPAARDEAKARLS